MFSNIIEAYNYAINEMMKNDRNSSMDLHLKEYENDYEMAFGNLVLTLETLIERRW